MNEQFNDSFNILQIWPDWQIVRKIGSGSYGSVYEIHRRIGGHLEKAALKVIHIPQSDEAEHLLLQNDGNVEKDGTIFQAQVEEIQHEIIVMQQFIGYTNIVSYAAWTESWKTFLLSNYLLLKKYGLTGKLSK